MTPREIIMQAISSPGIRTRIALEGYAPMCREIEKMLAENGFVIVPKEPSPDMLHKVWLQPVGRRLFDGEPKPENQVVCSETSADIYKKMVAAVEQH